MHFDEKEIQQLKSDVAKLASRLHVAKVAMDRAAYKHTGFVDAQVRSNTRNNPAGRDLYHLWTNGTGTARDPLGTQQSVFYQDLKAKMAAYKEAHRDYFVAKAMLQEAETDREIELGRQEAEDLMKDRTSDALDHAFKSNVLTGAAFGIEQHPALIRTVTEGLREVVQQMRAERTLASIAAVVETVSASDQLGYGSVTRLVEYEPNKYTRPSSEREDAIQAATQMAKEIMKKSGGSPSSPLPTDRERHDRLKTLLQLLGGD